MKVFISSNYVMSGARLYRVGTVVVCYQYNPNIIQAPSVPPFSSPYWIQLPPESKLPEPVLVLHLLSKKEGRRRVRAKENMC